MRACVLLGLCLGLAACLGLGACRGPEPAGATGPAAPPPTLLTAPPAGPIHTVAITEAGDAALTADDGGGWRLWPALDPQRAHPPIVIEATPAPRHAVLGRADGGGLVAAVIDETGALELLRFTREGALAGRAQLPPDPGFESAAAFGGGVLALRRDQLVLWLGADGAVRARLAPPKGEFLVELTARRGRALAGVGRPGGASSGVRWLEPVGGALRWGAYRVLLDPLRALALAPDHRRLAGLREGLSIGQVVSLEAMTYLEDSLRVGELRGAGTIGFYATGRAVMGSGSLLRQGTHEVALDERALTAPAVFGDARAVIGHGTSLALVEAGADRPRYLGYAQVGAGELTAAGAHFAMATGEELLWLDGRLAAVRPPFARGRHGGAALDGRLVLEQVPERPSSEAGPWELAVTDAATGARNPLGVWQTVTGIQLDPRSRVAAIQSGAEVRRFAIGERGHARELPALSFSSAPALVLPFDPAAARGIEAIAIWVDGGTSEELELSLSLEVRPARGAPVRSLVRGILLGADEAALLWLAQGRTVFIPRASGAALEVELPAVVDLGVVRRDGTLAVVRSGELLVALDAAGREVWRRELAAVQQLALSGDGRTVAVKTRTGLLALDANTGARLAWACGWSFGIRERAVADTGAICQPD